MKGYSGKTVVEKRMPEREVRRKGTAEERRRERGWQGRDGHGENRKDSGQLKRNMLGVHKEKKERKEDEEKYQGQKNCRGKQERTD